MLVTGVCSVSRISKVHFDAGLCSGEGRILHIRRRHPTRSVSRSSSCVGHSWQKLQTANFVASKEGALSKARRGLRIYRGDAIETFFGLLFIEVGRVTQSRQGTLW